MEAPHKIQYFLEKSSQVARCKDWQSMAEQMLALLQEISQAEAAVLYPPVSQEEKGALGFSAAAPAQQISARKTNSLQDEQSYPWRGCPQGLSTTWWKALRNKFTEPGMFQSEHPRWIDQGTNISEPFLQQAFANLKQLKNLLVLPLKYSRGAPGWIVLVNASIGSLELAALFCERLSIDLEKTAELETARQRETRLMALNDILGQLGANLNPDQVLRIFIERARQFLQVEAVSLFLVDESNGELVMQIASQADNTVKVEKIRVPPGIGIIGQVVQGGETLLVEDAQHDQRHYHKVDQTSGFHTQSILAVPLRTRPIDLGQGRGTSRERIIGGLEAVNKIGGGFRAEDIELLQVLAKGASTILVVAQLYLDANNLFVDVIQALVAAIDAKDPYTVGHSQRVSDYSAEIARELGQSEEEIYHIRLGSLFHDVGKIGIPDRILRKTGSLSQQETVQMHAHPEIGERIMRKVRLMGEEIQAFSEHHERLDGSGYPSGLQGSQIPLISRIVAVADVFDAMTSDRPYRQGMAVEEVFVYLRENANKHFDADCVEALIRAYQRGAVQTQSQRIRLGIENPGWSGPDLLSL